jgi:predicted nucleic acid-binding protein
MAVVDASVAIALINADEPDHAVSRSWFGRTISARETVSAPFILLAEIAAALSRGRNDPNLAHRVVSYLLRTNLIQLWPVTPSIAERAASIAADYRIRGCDAIYVALAEQLDGELVTLDRQQLERGAAVVTTRQPPT